VTGETIAAIATAPGVGGVGIIRISGPLVSHIAVAVTGRELKPRYATYRRFLASDGTEIDEGIAVFFPAPHSYTGEDVLELQGHGGPVVMDLLLTRCLELRARQARPGEFTERAFFNGKLDLAQAEAIADLIASTTSLAAKLAVRSLQGFFSQRAQSLVEDLIRLRSVIEATLDFPEEELDSGLDRMRWSETLDTLIDSAKRVLSEAHQGARIRDGLTVVIAGRTNAGKSSLFNVLVQSEAAIVTPMPGTTRDILRADIQLNGLPVKLVDTAGIRESPELVEQEGVRRAREQFHQADRILWVYDSSVGLDPSDLRDLPAAVPVTLVRNKMDLCLPTIDPEHGNELPEIPVSALSGFGIEELRQHLKATAGVEGLGEGSFVARRRHLVALGRGLNSLRCAQTALQGGSGSEVVALDLLAAQHAFSEITGTFTPDDLLGRIFSSFCIGK
jgi:tRNA modification GTPase